MTDLIDHLAELQYLEPPAEPPRCPICGSIDISAGGRCLHCGTNIDEEGSLEDSVLCPPETRD